MARQPNDQEDVGRELNLSSRAFLIEPWIDPIWRDTCQNSFAGAVEEKAVIKSWMVIGGITILLGAAGGSIVPPEGLRWFKRLRRPSWLTFEALIPLIWTVVFICGAWSAYIVWEHEPGSSKTWTYMGAYLLLELVTLSYNTAMVWTRRLRVGTIVGATGFVIAAILAIVVSQVSTWAAVLLVPYLLWSPIGTFTTWKMQQLNPLDA